jgi:hypothetical protein
VGQAVIALTGLYVMPMGVDDDGLEYWHFPCAPEDLFICTKHLPEIEKERFAAQV